MSISRIVKISRLYPSNIEDVSKVFRSSAQIENPYDRCPQNKGILSLIREVEYGENIEDSSRQNGPYSLLLDRKIEQVNLITKICTEDKEQQIPNVIRWLQLAHFHDPEVDGKKYSYGIMMHKGLFNLSSPEFAILLPCERQNIPALILSNNSFNEDPINLITETLQYAREHPINSTDFI